MAKKNSYLEQLRRKQRAAAEDRGRPGLAEAARKPPAEMTDVELATELRATEQNIRRLSEEAVEAGRGSGKARPSPFVLRKRRPLWK